VTAILLFFTGLNIYEKKSTAKVIDFDLDGSVWFAINQGVCKLYNDEFENVPVKINNILMFDKPALSIIIKHSNRLDILYEPVSKEKIIIKLYNFYGTMVSIKSFMPANEKTIHLSMNIGDNNSGIYIVQIIQGNYSVTKKILINKN